MQKFILITGGARSGKSSFAQNSALANTDNPVYLATARVLDEDFEIRVKNHRDDRDNRWINIEEDKDIEKIDLEGKVVVLDCITLWLTNLFFDNGEEINNSLNEAKSKIELLMKKNACIYAVTNEIGMGVHPENEIARRFADLQGWVNQFIAQKADEVYFMVSGIPQKIK